MRVDGYAERARFDDFSFIARHYRFDSVDIVKDLGGAYNLNLLLETGRGRYVLRVYRPWVTRARLAQIHHVKGMLAHAGFPVPLPLQTSTGETILRYQDRLLEVEPFVDHDGEADTWERTIVGFSLLGKLHTFLAESTANFPLIEPVVSNYETLETLLAWTQQAVDEVTEFTENTFMQERQQALSLYAEAVDLLTLLQARWEKTEAQLPRQLTHGDYGGGNLLFQQNRVVAILDFDFLRTRERVYEIAYTLYWWLIKQGQGWIEASNSWSGVRELLAAYNKTARQPLTQDEIQAIPFEMARVPLYWIAETHLLPDPVQAVIKQAGKVADARWIMEWSGQLADLFV